MVDFVSWLCCDTSNLILSFIGSTLSLCLQDGSDCRQRSLLCLWACLFRNSFDRTESTHHGPKLCTWKERGFVSEEHPKVSTVTACQHSFQTTVFIDFNHCCMNPAVTWIMEHSTVPGKSLKRTNTNMDLQKFHQNDRVETGQILDTQDTKICLIGLTSCFKNNKTITTEFMYKRAQCKSFVPVGHGIV